MNLTALSPCVTVTLQLVDE